MVPAAVSVLLVPSFFVSVLLERLVCKRVWKNFDPKQVNRGVFAANLVSYALLFLLACGLMVFQLATKGVRVKPSWQIEELAPSETASPKR
jgi:hypothetical protein